MPGRRRPDIHPLQFLDTPAEVTDAVTELWYTHAQHKLIPRWRAVCAARPYGRAYSRYHARLCRILSADQLLTYRYFIGRAHATILDHAARTQQAVTRGTDDVALPAAYHAYQAATAGTASGIADAAWDTAGRLAWEALHQTAEALWELAARADRDRWPFEAAAEAAWTLETVETPLGPTRGIYPAACSDHIEDILEYGAKIEHIARSEADRAARETCGGAP